MNPRQTVQNYFDIIGGGEGDLFACLSDDIVWHLPPHHPFGSEYKGKAAVAEMMAKGMPMFEADSLAIEVEVIVAEGDNAFAHFRMRARTASGADYDNEYLFRFRVANALIVEIWESMDTLYMRELKMF